LAAAPFFYLLVEAGGLAGNFLSLLLFGVAMKGFLVVGTTEAEPAAYMGYPNYSFSYLCLGKKDSCTKLVTLYSPSSYLSLP
jgi:hypothetical protein